MKPTIPSTHFTARARAALIALFAASAAIASSTAFAAGPGSGNAALAPAASVPAGTAGSWVVTYYAAEAFPHGPGGYVEIEVPAGWTAPTLAAGQPGEVTVSSPHLNSVTIVPPRTIRLFIGDAPATKFDPGDSVRVVYGGGGGAGASSQTNAPANALFQVRSDPDASDGVTPVPLDAGSPSVAVVPGALASVRIEDGAGAPVGPFTRSADEDTTTLRLAGYDPFGNSVGPVSGAWSVSGGIGSVSPTSGSSVVLTLTTAGSGSVSADAGGFADTTGTLTVVPGAYAGVTASGAASAVAGGPWPLGATAVDADGNAVASGPGSGALLRAVAFADSAGATPADPDWVSDTVTLSSGAFAGSLTPRRSGGFWIGLRDDGTGFESPRTLVSVAAGPPHHLVLAPAALSLAAGVPAPLTVEVRDEFENPSPLTAAEPLALWSNRAAGTFQDLGGSPIFDVTIPAGATSASFRFRDTQTTASPGSIRAIDTGFAPPFLGFGEASVTTSPGAPSGTIALSVAPDTLEADGSAAAAVSAVSVRDAYGNPVGAGELVTVTGTLVVPLGDADGGTPGVQWATGAGGSLAGTVAAGLARGAGSVALSSVNGDASGSAGVTLLAGPPAGAIAPTALPDTITADGAATAAISAAGLEDANGNPVEEGERFTVSTDLGTIATADADPGTPGVQVAASGGAISFTLLAGTVVGDATASVASVRGSAAGSVSIRLREGAVDAARSLVSATSPANVGPVGSIATVTLRDAQDHPVAGIPAASVSIAVAGVPATATALAGATDASGALAFRVTTTLADTAVVSVVAGGVPLAATATIAFVPGAVDHYTAAGPPAPLLAGRADTLRVAARDSYENLVPAVAGSRMSVRVLGGLAVAPDTVTFASAIVDVPFTPTAVTQLSLLVREVTGALRSVTYGPVAVAPAGPHAIDSVHVAPASIAAGDSATFSVWVADVYGNLRPGASVAASVVSGSGGVSPAAATTDAGGLARFRIAGGPLPGPLAVRAVVSASAAPDSVRADTVAVQVVPGVAASIQIANATGGIVAGGLLNVNLTLRDAFGNVALGAAPLVRLWTTTPSPALDNVRWSQTAGAAGTLADSTASDGAEYQFAAADSGTAILAVRDTLAETIRLRVSGLGLAMAETAPVTIGAAPPTQIAVVSGDGQTGVAGDTLAAPLRVRARDTFGNPAPGAAVRFAVTGGGGAIDAILGGGPDSDATADASGVATCAVWRLGTTAGIGNQSARATLLATPTAFSTFIATASADTLASLALAPGALSLAPTQTAAVTATARDVYGNPVPGAPLTLYLAGPASGTLQPVAGATTGGPGSQSGSTDALGRVSVRYAAPSAAPAVDSIYVRGPTAGPVGIRVVVATGAVDLLRVTPDSLAWTAGVPVRVHVVPLDAQGNVVTGDGGTADMRAAAGVSFAPTSGPIASGEFQTFATATVAGTILSIGADRAGSPGVGGAAGPVTVRPAAPSGTIPVAATRTTLTADGKSLATVTFGPVRDAFGNLVAAGSALSASASAGSLPSGSLATDAAGFASTILVAPASAGPGTVSVASVPAGASGSLGFTFLAPPSLTASAASVSPPVVVPGAAASFQVDVTNGGSDPITLGPSTRFSFGPAASPVNADLAAPPVAVPAGGSVTLSFASVTLPAALPPGSYAPTLRAVGTDATGEPFDFYPSLAGAAVHVAGIRVVAGGVAPSPAPLGADLTLTFTVENLAAFAATIESGSLSFSQGIFTLNGLAPALPAALPALGTVALTASVRAPDSGIPDGAVVDAVLTAGARFGGATVNAANAPALQIPIVSGASITAVAGGTAPARLLRGRTAAPVARVRNDGASDVTLLRGPTLLVLGHAGGDTLRVSLRANQVVSGGGTADLAFDSLSVPAATALGSYGATLVLRGTEAGQPFAADVACDPAAIPALDPALLAASALAPDTVSAGQSRPVRVTVTNAGGVPFDAGPATTLRFGAPVSTTLALAAPVTIAAGGAADLDFTAAPLGFGASPGSAAATLELRGAEDGRSRDESLAAGTLHARPPASLAYVPASASPDTVRAGQTIPMTAAVRNGGGSPFVVDPAATRLTVTDGVESAVAFAAGAPFILAPGAQATLAFPSVAFPAALASQPYPVSLTVHGTEWARPESAAVVSPPGELRVVEPAAAVQVSSLDVGAPVQAAAGAGALRIWGLRFETLVPSGGAASTRLESLALTILAEGAPATSPNGLVAAIEVRDAGGALVAQAVPGASGPAVLLFAPPIDLSLGALPLYLDVVLQAGVEAGDVALRLAAASDVAALDNLTGSPVPVTAIGGLPFAAIDSRRVTLFAKPHGYPNPFRAGRESVLLSYRLAGDASVKVRIVTLFGELVRELSFPGGGAGGARGLNEVPWDGRNGSGAIVTPGVYVARIEGGGVSESVKIGVRR